jgi:hypothetical protein
LAEKNAAAGLEVPVFEEKKETVQQNEVAPVTKANEAPAQ